MKRTLFGFTAAALFAGSAVAVPLASDDFSYPDGSLVPNGGWANQSGTLGEAQVSGGALVLDQGSGSEDPELTFASDLTTGIVTATFDIVVTATAMTGSDFEYFAHFSNDTEFNFRSRLDVQVPGAGGDYTLGIATTSSTGEAALPIDFTFGETVSVILTYDIDAGLGSVTAGGQTATSTTVSLGDTIDTINFRQSGSSSDEVITIDNLVVEYVPEPSSLALLGLGGLLIARRRRG